MDNTVYDQITHQNLFLWITVGLIILTASFFCLLYLRKNKMPKYIFVAALILILVVMLGTIISVGDIVIHFFLQLYRLQGVTK